MSTCYLLSTAPMIDYSDRHSRYFWRLFSSRARLYTEMIHAQAILNQNREGLLEYSSEEHPLALQVGGNDPQALAACAVYAKKYGYDEINLNVGCPSARVQSGHFGVCLMKEPKLISHCVASMIQRVDLPVTVKTRIGVDKQDSYEFLCEFIKTVSEAGCEEFIIHARKAWLKGLSPKQNRDIPPLMYERVYQLKKDFPKLKFILNGGIKEINTAKQHLNKVDGIMVGREVCRDPYFLSQLEKTFYDSEIPRRENILQRYVTYAEQKQKEGIPLKILLKPLLGLFHGQADAKQKRHYLLQCNNLSQFLKKTMI